MNNSQNEKIFYAGIRNYMGKKLAEDLDQIEASLEDPAVNPPLGKVHSLQRKSKSIYAKIAISAVLILTVGFFFWNQFQPSEIMQIDQFEEKYILKSQSRSPNTDIEHSSTRGQNLYAIGDFKPAIPLLKKDWETTSDSISLFYLGVSYAALGKDKKAREVLKLVQNKEWQSKIQDLLN